MSMGARLRKLEQRLRECLPQQTVVVVAVNSFKPGPHADRDGPMAIIVRDPNRRCRVLGSLRDFYDATVMDPARSHVVGR
jgi:hypothetical protein